MKKKKKFLTKKKRKVMDKKKFLQLKNISHFRAIFNKIKKQKALPKMKKNLAANKFIIRILIIKSHNLKINKTN